MNYKNISFFWIFFFQVKVNTLLQVNISIACVLFKSDVLTFVNRSTFCILLTFQKKVTPKNVTDRKVTKRDREPLNYNKRIYKNSNAKLKLINALLSKQNRHWFNMGHGNFFSFFWFVFCYYCFLLFLISDRSLKWETRSRM